MNQTQQRMERLAAAIDRAGLGPLVMLALESTRPLHHPASQLGLVASPLLDTIIPGKWWETIRSALEKPQIVDDLLLRLESLQRANSENS